MTILPAIALALAALSDICMSILSVSLRIKARRAQRERDAKRARLKVPTVEHPL